MTTWQGSQTKSPAGGLYICVLKYRRLGYLGKGHSNQCLIWTAVLPLVRPLQGNRMKCKLSPSRNKIVIEHHYPYARLYRPLYHPSWILPKAHMKALLAGYSPSSWRSTCESTKHWRPWKPGLHSKPVTGISLSPSSTTNSAVCPTPETTSPARQSS